MHNFTEINKNVQKELNQKVMFIAKICLISGICGLVLAIALGMFFEDQLWVDYITLFFSFIFAYGLVVIILINNINKKVISKIQINEYEFLDEYFNVTTRFKEEVVGTSKVYYKDIIKTKITPSYLFIYINKYQAFPVERNKITLDEFIQLNTLIKDAKKKQP